MSNTKESVPVWENSPESTGPAGDLYRSLVEANPAQLWTARPDGGLDYINPRAAEYAGMSADLLLGTG